MWTWVVVAVVVVVVVVAVLFVTGVLGSHSSGGIGNGTPVAFNTAVAVAATQASSATGGPWTVVAAEGVGIGSGIAEPNWQFVGSSGCTFAPVPGGSNELTILGTPSGSVPGEVATWFFFAKNASANGVLLSAVSNGQASSLVIVTGCSAVATFTSMAAISATTDVNSTTVAASLDASGGSAFLASNPGSTQLFILLGATSATPGAWDVEYSTCALTALGGSGSWFSAFYNASNGNPLTTPTSGSGSC